MLFMMLYRVPWQKLKISFSNSLENWNGHTGQKAKGFEGVNDEIVFSERNIEGETLFEFASSFDLLVANSFFHNQKSQHVTFHSGYNQSQIDILVKKQDFRYAGGKTWPQVFNVHHSTKEVCVWT